MNKPPERFARRKDDTKFESNLYNPSGISPPSQEAVDRIHSAQQKVSPVASEWDGIDRRNLAPSLYKGEEKRSVIDVYYPGPERRKNR